MTITLQHRAGDRAMLTLVYTLVGIVGGLAALAVAFFTLRPSLSRLVRGVDARGALQVTTEIAAALQLADGVNKHRIVDLQSQLASQQAALMAEIDKARAEIAQLREELAAAQAIYTEAQIEHKRALAERDATIARLQRELKQLRPATTRRSRAAAGGADHDHP